MICILKISVDTSKEEIGPVIPTPTSIAETVEEDRSVADMDVVPESAMAGGIMAANSFNQGTAFPGLTSVTITTTISKKEKKKKEKKFICLAASTTWEDPTLAEWAQGKLLCAWCLIGVNKKL